MYASAVYAACLQKVIGIELMKVDFLTFYDYIWGLMSTINCLVTSRGNALRVDSVIHSFTANQSSNLRSIVSRMYCSVYIVAVILVKFRNIFKVFLV